MKNITKSKEEIILKKVAELNKHIGTTEIDKYYRAAIKVLPQGWHLDFGLHSNQYCVVDHMGARVL